MSGNILHLFRPSGVRPPDLGWLPNELAEFYRVVALLARSGLAVSLQTGVSDEGDPWAVIVRDDTGDVLVHLARMDGQFVVASAAGPPARRGRDLRAVVDAAMADSPMVSAPVRKSDSLFLHPATLLAAFIVTAWAHTETLQSRDGRPEPASPDQRAPQPQAPAAVRSAGSVEASSAPSGPALAQAAAALLAVSAYVTAQAGLQGPVAPRVDPDTFVQAALAYERGEASVPQEAAEGLAGSEAGAVSREADGWTVADTPSGWLVAPSSEERPGQSIGHAPAALPGAGVVSFSLEVWGMSSEVDTGLVLAAEMDVAEAAPTQRVQAPSKQGPDARASTEVESASAGRALPDAEAPSVLAAPGGSWQAQDQTFSIGPIYETAARLLHLLPFRADGLGGPDGYGLPVAAAFAAPMPAAADESLASPPTSPAEPQPEPEANQNAQILLGFMADQSRIVGDLEIPWATLLLGVTEAPEASKVLIFDAGWLAGRSFMLMPGVLMVEDDLLGDAIDVSAHFQAPAAFLNLGDGLSLKLLGIVDILDT